MNKRQVAVLDIGSGKIELLVGERGLNGTYFIKSRKQRRFSVYYGGELIDSDEFSEQINALIGETEASLRFKLTRIYVGVPGEFSAAFCKLGEISLPRRKRIDGDDINAAFNSAVTKKYENYFVINRSAVYFTLSDGSRTHDPIGKTSDKLGGLFSYYLCGVKFKKTVDIILKTRGIREVLYNSTSLAEAMYLFGDEERDLRPALIDCGYLSTVFSYICGDGILYERVFPLGGGIISGKLMETFQGDDTEVFERLKEQVNLSLKCFSDAVYSFSVGKREYEFSVTKVNRVVFDVLDCFAEEIIKCIDEGVAVKSDAPKIYITGGGINNIRGAKEYLTDKLAMVISSIAPQLPQLDKPVNSSVLSLLELALRQNDETGGFFSRLFGK